MVLMKTVTKTKIICLILLIILGIFLQYNYGSNLFQKEGRLENNNDNPTEVFYGPVEKGYDEKIYHTTGKEVLLNG